MIPRASSLGWSLPAASPSGTLPLRDLRPAYERGERAALARGWRSFASAAATAGKPAFRHPGGSAGRTAAEHPEDRELIGAAAREVNALNAKYGGGFFLLGRPRVYTRRAGLYGLGAQTGRDSGPCPSALRQALDIRVLSGSSLGLRGTRYILTLDADTRLEPGCARELVGAMLHPLNTPVVDKKRRVVTAGHAVVQPRMAVELPAATKSEFARVFAGQGGTDPYGCDAGEVYMDLFGRAASPARESWTRRFFSNAWTVVFRKIGCCPTTRWRAPICAGPIWGTWSSPTVFPAGS